MRNTLAGWAERSEPHHDARSRAYGEKIRFARPRKPGVNAGPNTACGGKGRKRPCGLAVLAMLAAIAVHPALAAEPEKQPHGATAGLPSSANNDAVENNTAGQAGSAAPPEVTAPVVPERHLKFEVSDRQYPVKLPEKDVSPKLLEQRYVAVFEMQIPALPATQVVDAQMARGLPVYDISELLSRYLGLSMYEYGGYEGGGGFGFGGAPEANQGPNDIVRMQWFNWLHGNAYTFLGAAAHGSCRDVIAAMPERDRPASKTILWFTTEAGVHMNVESRGFNPNGSSTAYIEIYAPTPELAEEAVTALLAIYDRGFSKPLQQELIKARAEAVNKAEEAAAARKEAEQKAAGLEKPLEPLKQYADITSEMLVNLKTQQRMIGIDIVGVEARIKACENNPMFRETKKMGIQGNPLVEQIEALKVAAEVELAGLTAKKAAMQQIVEGVKEKERLQKELASARGQVQRREKEALQYTTEAEIFAKLRRMAEPLPVEGGTVTIHPIQWAPAAEGGKPGGAGEYGGN